MKKVAFAIFITAILAGCASAPKPKIPNENYRVPVNKTVPVELLNEAI